MSVPGSLRSRHGIGCSARAAAIHFARLAVEVYTYSMSSMAEYRAGEGCLPGCLRCRQGVGCSARAAAVHLARL